MRGIDATLQRLDGGTYDLKIGFDGDLETEDSFDAAILVSLLADARASESEVPEASRRRGWIGNELTPGFELGSKLWLYEQSRVTRTTLNGIQDAARLALRWLVDEGYAAAVREVSASIEPGGRATLEVAIERSPSVVERRFFDLWTNTGRSG